jgi:hypothetical protein
MGIALLYFTLLYTRWTLKHINKLQTQSTHTYRQTKSQIGGYFLSKWESGQCLYPWRRRKEGKKRTSPSVIFAQYFKEIISRVTQLLNAGRIAETSSTIYKSQREKPGVGCVCE